MKYWQKNKKLGGFVVKLRMYSTVVLGLWLMISPFVLSALNRGRFDVVWEDLILGFGVMAFSVCRLLSRKAEELELADWMVIVFGLLTLLNPLLYNYHNLNVARWNNLLAGGVVFLLAVFQDWRDSDRSIVSHRHPNKLL
jgi:hypothetical protein